MIDEGKWPEPDTGATRRASLRLFQIRYISCALTLGGVLTLSESVSDRFSRYALTAVLILVELQAVSLRFSGVSEMCGQRAPVQTISTRNTAKGRSALLDLVSVFSSISSEKKLSGAS